MRLREPPRGRRKRGRFSFIGRIVFCRTNDIFRRHNRATPVEARPRPIVGRMGCCRARPLGARDGWGRRSWTWPRRSTSASGWRRVPSRSPAIRFSDTSPERAHLPTGTCSTLSLSGRRPDHQFDVRRPLVYRGVSGTHAGRQKAGRSSRRWRGICARPFSIRARASGSSRTPCGRPAAVAPPRSAKCCMTFTMRTSGGREALSPARAGRIVSTARFVLVPHASAEARFHR